MGLDDDTTPDGSTPGLDVPGVKDVLGIGEAAKSPAAKEAVRALARIIGTVTDPTRALLMGLAKNKVEGNRIVSMARAEAKARKISVEADALIERMKERMIATEIRHQLNIETTVSDAVEHLN